MMAWQNRGTQQDIAGSFAGVSPDLSVVPAAPLSPWSTFELLFEAA